MREILTLGLWSALGLSFRIMIWVIASHGVLLRGLWGGALDRQARLEAVRAQQMIQLGY
jgi:hypothetical protein